MLRIGVLGGGLCGRLTALTLARQGYQVELFDSGDKEGKDAAAYWAAAMLAPAAESIDATAEVVRLGYQSLPLWRDLIHSLQRHIFMQEKGSLIVWHGQDKPLANQFIQRLTEVNAEYHIWQRTDIADGEPQLAGRFDRGIYLPSEGQLDNRQILVALGDELESIGVMCHWYKKASIDALSIDFDWVIDCRGVGAKDIWQHSGGSRLRGVRGEVARVFAPEVCLNRPVRLLHPRYPLYIAPKEEHVFVIGATQIESESGRPVSVRSGLELLSALYTVHPAFGEAEITELGAGLRPTLNHHNPEIRYSMSKNLIEINGLFRHGFMIAPAVVEAANRLLRMMVQEESVPERCMVSGLNYIQCSD